jgi:hypothetical protein
VSTKRLLVVGHGRAGKDTALEHLALITGLKNAGTTSLYLAKYVAEALGVPKELAYAERHQNREIWKRIGDEIRQDDPTKLIREALAVGPLTGGVRDIAEVAAARAEGLFDLIVWVQNDRVPPDPTVTFTERECDVVIQNNWGLCEFKKRLENMAKFGGFLSSRDFLHR